METISWNEYKATEEAINFIFGSKMAFLSVTERLLLVRDVYEVAIGDEDFGPLDTEGARDFLGAARELRSRIGGKDNLRSYVDCLVAKQRGRNAKA